MPPRGEKVRFSRSGQERERQNLEHSVKSGTEVNRYSLIGDRSRSWGRCPFCPARRFCCAGWTFVFQRGCRATVRRPDDQTVLVKLATVTKSAILLLLSVCLFVCLSAKRKIDGLQPMPDILYCFSSVFLGKAAILSVSSCRQEAGVRRKPAFSGRTHIKGVYFLSYTKKSEFHTLYRYRILITASGSWG